MVTCILINDMLNFIKSSERSEDSYIGLGDFLVGLFLGKSAGML